MEKKIKKRRLENNNKILYNILNNYLSDKGNKNLKFLLKFFCCCKFNIFYLDEILFFIDKLAKNSRQINNLIYIKQIKTMKRKKLQLDILNKFTNFLNSNGLIITK